MTAVMSNTECHTRAAVAVDSAVLALKRAIKAESGLEWTPALEELLRESEHVGGKLREYARFAKGER